jgi:tape measure domain-containing protein
LSTASGLDLARLSIIFDTTTAPTAISAMQQVASQSRTVGQAIDQQTVKQRENTKAALETARALEQLGVAHAAAASGYKRGSNDGAAYARTVMDIKRALDEEAKAAAMVASGHQQRAAAISRLMVQTRNDYQAGALSAKQYADNLGKLQVEMNKIAAPQQTIATSGREAANSMTLLTGAFGGFFGVLGFQGLTAMSQFTGFITSLPGDLAHAGDEFTRLNARITFAFRGSAEAARLARQDMIAMARETGTPLSQVSQSYGDLAIAGRGPGLSRGQIGGLVGGFSMLGAMTGADNASTGRAMWQFQQALALGRLTSQDYRFMATNLPAIDDALAAGMGVDVNTIPGRISRGEIDANKMVDALIRGVEILRDTSGGIPETMERARGRVQTEWELMLHDMEEALRSSDMVRGLLNGVAGGINDTRMFYGGPSQERIAWMEGLRESNPYAYRNYGGDAELRRMEEIVNDPGARRTRWRQGAAERRREQEVQRNAVLGRGLQAADGAFSLDLQRADVNQSIAQIEAAMGVAGAANAPAEDVAKLARALTAFRTQLARLVSVAERRLADVQFAEQDLARYGVGGFDMAQQARSLAEQSAAQGSPIGMDGALGIIRRERRLGIDRDIAGRVAGNSDRQIIVDAAGLDAAARRRASLDAELQGWRRDNPAATDEQASAFRRARATEMAQGDVQALRERERADRERLASMQAQLQMGIRLGQQGRIALAQAERERELRLQFPEITNELVAAERARVAENVRIAEQLDLQREQLARLQDAAETAGRAMGDALSSGIIAGLRSGQDGIDAILNSLQQSGERILSNLLGNVTAPIERRITEMAGGQLGRIFGRGDADKSVEALSKAATEAADGIASGMTPAIVEAATKTALSTSATATDAAMTSKATLAVSAFGAAVTKATLALEAMAAAGGEETGSSLVSSIASAFSGGSGSPSIPKFARGVRNFSGGLAIVGEEGAELVELPRGANVYSHNQSKAMMGGGGVSIVINDQRGANAAPVEQRESRGPNGERQIELYIKDQQTKNLASDPDVTAAMSSRFGVRPMVKKS